MLNFEQKRILKALFFGHPESNEQKNGSFNAISMSEILNISVKQKKCNSANLTNTLFQFAIAKAQRFFFSPRGKLTKYFKDKI